jgi:hypothetical protein
MDPRAFVSGPPPPKGRAAPRPSRADISAAARRRFVPPAASAGVDLSFKPAVCVAPPPQAAAFELFLAQWSVPPTDAPPCCWRAAEARLRGDYAQFLQARGQTDALAGVVAPVASAAPCACEIASEFCDAD